MKLYRICTENKPYLPELAAQYFESFYITTGTGYWRGVPEQGATIDIIDHDTREVWDRLTMLAYAIKEGQEGEPTQEAVYITITDVVLTVI